ncbi:amidohydrolase family protein [Robiginitomaculum antarcticum]|uniref:amidohydrolase family protein n=1 Tax=Robiginitomaculum antarcticum TaxID=437507 RepID=UPI00037FC299|nr:amidohydrolase family protein [Robiginitomaculum antarcticum]
MRKLLTTALSVSLLAIAIPAMAQDSFAIINAKVVTNTGPTIENATVLVQDGKIRGIGATDSSAAAPKPNGTSIIDGTGLWVTPGIFAPYGQVGLVEVSLESSTRDTRAGDSISQASLKAAEGFNPKSSSVSATRGEGVTHVAIGLSPRASVFGGIGAIATMSGDFDSVQTPEAFAYVQLGSNGANLAGGNRSASMAQLRQGLSDATRRYTSPDDGDAVRRADALALRPVVAGRIPLMIGADRASDLQAIAGLKRDFPNLRLVVLGASEGWMVADALTAANVSVLIDPQETLPYSFDQVATRADNGARLQAAGVRVAFMQRSSEFSHNVRLLPQHAGNAVAQGFTWDQAFKAITLTPAQIFGRPDLGTLTVGQTANLVVWDGDPLEVMTGARRVVIDGEVQDMTSRQTELAKRYNPNNTSDMPHGYRR